MSDRLKLIEEVLNSWKFEFHIKGLSVISRTGLPLIHTFPIEIDINQVSAMIAAVVEAVENAALCIQPSKLIKVKAELNPLNFLIYCLGSTEILIILCDHEKHMKKVEKSIPRLFQQLEPFL